VNKHPFIFEIELLYFGAENLQG